MPDIMNTPLAEDAYIPTDKPGRWIDSVQYNVTFDFGEKDYLTERRCSVCGRVSVKWKGGSYDFCPWCGSSMRRATE